MIRGTSDTFYTVPEFARLVGRTEKTIRNWASEGRITLVHLCGVPLVSLKMVENLIGHYITNEHSEEALELLLARDRSGPAKRRKPRKRGEGSEEPQST
jgi:predicted transcriptional regulator